jgi:D-glycero-D-manno-heptose 1,7-bisphosphate phosphatase
MKGAPRRAVFLDRDGVLNRAVVRDGRPYPPASLAVMQINPDAPEALQSLKTKGFVLLGITNQPDVARGKQRREVVESINASLVKALQLEDILVCYHDDKDQCTCRKPLPGLLLQAALRYEIDLGSSFVIGDRWKDVQAGLRAGCRTVLLDYGYREGRGAGLPDCIVGSLAEAVAWILDQPEC